MGGKGEGRRGEEEERKGHVFLTFRMVSGRASAALDLGGQLGQSLLLFMVKFRSRHPVKKVRFLLENNTFHLSRTLLLAGS